MATDAGHGKGYTAPKGRPTATRDVAARRSFRMPPTLEWVLLGLVLVAIVVVAYVFTTAGDGSPHGGLPADGPAPVVALPTG